MANVAPSGSRPLCLTPDARAASLAADDGLTVIIAFAGAIAGRVLGYAAALVLADQIALDSAVPVSIGYLPSLEPWLWVLPLSVALFAGAIPAWQAYRANILERLCPS